MGSSAARVALGHPRQKGVLVDEDGLADLAGAAPEAVGVTVEPQMSETTQGRPGVVLVPLGERDQSPSECRFGGRFGHGRLLLMAGPDCLRSSRVAYDPSPPLQAAILFLHPGRM